MSRIAGNRSGSRRSAAPFGRRACSTATRSRRGGDARGAPCPSLPSTPTHALSQEPPAGCALLHPLPDAVSEDHLTPHFLQVRGWMPALARAGFPLTIYCAMALTRIGGHPSSERVFRRRSFCIVMETRTSLAPPPLQKVRSGQGQGRLSSSSLITNPDKLEAFEARDSLRSVGCSRELWHLMRIRSSVP